MTQAKRICFLFNHDQTHQIAHSLPIALVLAEREGVAVTLAVTSDAIAGQIERIAGSSLLQMEIVRLDLQSTFSRFTRMAFDKIVPARKLLIYRDNLEFFRQFDAIVVTEKTSLILKTRYGLDQVKIIHTRHGAGDRSIGFNKESALFDLSLVAGEKIARRLQAEAGVSRDRPLQSASIPSPFELVRHGGTGVERAYRIGPLQRHFRAPCNAVRPPQCRNDSTSGISPCPCSCTSANGAHELAG